MGDSEPEKEGPFQPDPFYGDVGRKFLQRFAPHATERDFLFSLPDPASTSPLPLFDGIMQVYLRVGPDDVEYALVRGLPGSHARGFVSPPGAVNFLGKTFDAFEKEHWLHLLEPSDSPDPVTALAEQMRARLNSFTLAILGKADRVVDDTGQEAQVRDQADVIDVFSQLFRSIDFKDVLPEYREFSGINRWAIPLGHGLWAAVAGEDATDELTRMAMQPSLAPYFCAREVAAIHDRDLQELEEVFWRVQQEVISRKEDRLTTYNAPMVAHAIKFLSQRSQSRAGAPVPLRIVDRRLDEPYTLEFSAEYRTSTSVRLRWEEPILGAMVRCWADVAPQGPKAIVIDDLGYDAEAFSSLPADVVGEFIAARARLLLWCFHGVHDLPDYLTDVDEIKRVRQMKAQLLAADSIEEYIAIVNNTKRGQRGLQLFIEG